MADSNLLSPSLDDYLLCTKCNHPMPAHVQACRRCSAPWRVLLRLWSRTRNHRVALIAAMLASLLLTGGRLLAVLAMGYFVDHILGQAPTTLFVRIGVVTAALGLLFVSLYMGRLFLMKTVRDALSADMRSDCFDHLLHLPARDVENRPTGQWVSRITDDTDRIWTFMTAGLCQVVVAVGCVTISTLMLANIDAGFALWAVAPLIPAVMLTCATGRTLRHRSTRVWNLWGEMIERAAAIIPCIRAVKLEAAEDRESQFFRRQNDAVRRAQWKLYLLWIIFAPAMMGLLGLGLFGICWFSHRGVLEGRLTLGTAISAIGLTSQIYLPLVALGELFRQMQETITAGQRVFDLLGIRRERRARRPVTRSLIRHGRIELDSVSFEYETGRPVFQNVNLTIPEGESVGITGPSGAGKTTLACLIARLFIPTSGTIRIDGIDLNEFDPHALRRQIGLVLEDHQMLPGTIADNIVAGFQGVSKTEIHRAAQRAGADLFIEVLPNGYATAIGERGIKLSAGQRRRIMIARALVKDPPILILDEPLSFIDHQTAGWIRTRICELAQGRTVLTISHDPRNLAHCHRIARLCPHRQEIQLTYPTITQEALHSQLSQSASL